MLASPWIVDVELAEQLRLCRSQNDWDSVASLYERLQWHQPDSFPLALNRSSALWKADRPLEALPVAERARDLAPEEPLGWRGLGSVLKDLGRFEEADAAYGRSLELRDDPATRWSRAQNLMGLQRYGEAFTWGEARLELHNPPPYRPAPYWLGWPEAEAVTVWSEQGFGDVLQYLRWLPQLAVSGKRITLEMEAPLVSLVREGMGWCLPAGTRILPKCLPADAEAAAPAECQGSLMSLPLLLGGDPAPLIHQAHPYLKSSRWQQARRLRNGRRVGVVWAAGHQREDAYLVREYIKRSLPARPLRQLLHGLLVRDLEIVNLQIGPDRDQLPGWGGSFSEELPAEADFAATAELCSQLDLVISVDTATAHLCGALGLPAWMLLPWAADSRWLRGRRNSDWYPTLKLLRQPSHGDWQGLITLVMAHLDLWCADQALR
ncbi:hypothetical protein [Synechococcus sp. CS-1328]|uniref:hypothetical protein n=1 Tax=Synechococcus sp. CS-1328 TaxID=2847976 RepID=UPI00223B79DE|nr:hypothetical protein [Synechococcus sp. CS-1328]MCT0224357.1 tetratricopeptide repeat protein [Synechococcus sp. CS-1328]